MCFKASSFRWNEEAFTIKNARVLYACIVRSDLLSKLLQNFVEFILTEYALKDSITHKYVQV